MYEKYGAGAGKNKVADFLTIYIEEAHAKDDWSLPRGFNPFPGGDNINMHKVIAVKTCHS